MRSVHLMRGRFAALALLIALLGCAPGAFVGRESVSQAVAERTGHSFSAIPVAELSACPPNVDLSDGLSEEEAAALALWRNARFQEALAQLEISWAELMRAGQLINPQFNILFPVGVKQLEFGLTVPLDVLILRPRRVELAETEARRIAQQLVQEGLDTVRAARVAYADARLAQERLAVAHNSLQRRTEVARHAAVGVKAGDLSPLDSAAAEVYLQRSRADLRRATQECDLAGQRLAIAIGQADLHCPPMQGDAIPSFVAAPPDHLPALIEQTLASRPDLLAAAETVVAAEQRAGLAHYDYLVLQGILPDFNAQGDNGAEAGPGLNLTLPLFHQNQAAIARADADLELASRRLITLRQTAALEVAQSHGRLLQARDEWLAVTQQIEPRAASAYEASARAYPKRGTTLPLLLDLTRQLDEAQVRRVELMADLRRAAAELERSVGGRLGPPTAAGDAPR